MRFVIRATSSALAITALLAASGCTVPFHALNELRAADRFETDVKTLSQDLVSLHERVPYVSPDALNSCGVSCLDMVLGFEGCALAPPLARKLRERAEATGQIDNGAIRSALESLGFLAIHLQGDLRFPAGPDDSAFARVQNPLSHIRDGRPVILRVVDDDDRGHYVVLVAYDPSTRRVIVVNPGFGHQVWPEAELDRWTRSGRWFIAYKRPESPA